MSIPRKTLRKTGKSWRTRRFLLITLVSVLTAASIALYYVFTSHRVDSIEEKPRMLSVVSEASITCEHVEVEGNLVYLGGTCTVVVNVLNNENETITVHGIVIFYNGMSRQVSIPVTNVSVEPAQARTISGSFVLPERTLVYDGLNVFVKAFLRITYSGRYHSLLVESLHIDV